jgi:type 1 glutamine amidotransferase
VTGWCGLDREREAALPIDDSDGGCDDEPRCVQGSPWRRQIAALEILPGDAVTDSVEALHLMNQRGIEQVAVMGVHLNMCVLGRPFGIRQLVRQGKQVVLVRDLTDTMYNSRQRPQVPHFAGTELMVDHVERYWCSTVSSADFVGGRSFRFAADTRPRAVVMIGEDEYHTRETLPQFVADELVPRGFSVTVCREGPSDPGRFPGLARALDDADLVVVSVRRRALPPEELAMLRRHLEAGRGLVGIRTASHAFAPRGADRDRLVGGQRVEWPEFDPDVLGGNYQGHHGVGPVTRVSAVSGGAAHPILQGIDLQAFESRASLYKTRPLKPGVTLLLEGAIPGQTPEPLAWAHAFGPHKARVFYSSLGSPDDFREPRFRKLLANGIQWAAGRD